ncbi:MAG: hypothetical protein RIK87_22990 [Fuerstiella sp.]
MMMFHSLRSWSRTPSTCAIAGLILTGSLLITGCESAPGPSGGSRHRLHQITRSGNRPIWSGGSRVAGESDAADETSDGAPRPDSAFAAEFDTRENDSLSNESAKPLISSPFPPRDTSTAGLPELPDAAPPSTESRPRPETVQSSKDALAALTELGARIERDYDDVVRVIDLAFVKFTDQQAGLLASFDGVTELDLTGTGITDASVRYIAELSRLQSLKLKGTGISDFGMQRIGDLSHLKVLDLGRTQITNASLPQIKRLPELTYLLLNNNNITDNGITHLTTMQSLRGLNLIGSKITPEGWARLEKALPKCLVVYQTGDRLSFIRLPAEFSVAAHTATSHTEAGSDIRLRRLQQLAHQDPELAEHLASSYATAGQWQQSAAVLEVALVADPDNTSLRYRLAESLAHAGQTEEAYQHFSACIGLSAAHLAVGRITYEEALQKSASFLQRAVEFNPNNQDAHRLLAEIARRNSSRNLQQQTAEISTTVPVSTVSLPRIIPRAPINSDLREIPANHTFPLRSGSSAWTGR